MSDDTRSRLCPDCRNDSISRKACTACAQARRINDVERTVAELVERVEQLEANAGDNAEDTTRESTPLPDGGKS